MPEREGARSPREINTLTLDNLIIACMKRKKKTTWDSVQLYIMLFFRDHVMKNKVHITYFIKYNYEKLNFQQYKEFPFIIIGFCF